MKTAPHWNTIIKNHQKPSLWERLGRFIATPFVGIYNLIKSCIECKQEIPSNFTDNSTSSNLYVGKPELIGEYVIDMNDNPLATKEGTQEQPSNQLDNLGAPKKHSNSVLDTHL